MKYIDKRPSQQTFKILLLFITACYKFIHQYQLKFSLIISNSRDMLYFKWQLYAALLSDDQTN